jgi:hypothetical protein
MLKTTYVLASTLLIVGLALAPGAEATGPPPPIFLPVSSEPPPRSCTMTGFGPGKSVVITAGPNMAEPFPNPVACPAGVPGQCLEWEYKFTYTNLDPTPSGLTQSFLYVSFDTDTAVYSGTANPQVSNILEGVDDIVEGGAAERLLIFNAKTGGFCTDPVCTVSFVTGPAGIGTLTGGFRQGLIKKTCAIAGAGDPTDPTGVAGLSEPKTFQTTTLGCTIKWTQSADGCVTEASVVAGACTVNNDNPDLTGDATFAASCTTEINTQAGSAPCSVSRWNSTLGTWTTVTAFTSPPCTP